MRCSGFIGRFSCHLAFQIAAQPGQRFLQVGDAVGVAQAEVALGLGGAEVFAGYEHHAGIAHDLEAEVPAVGAVGGAVGVHIKRAVRPHGHAQAQGVEAGHDQVAAALELGAAAFVFGQGVGFEAGQRGLLCHAAGADEQIAGHAFQRSDERGRHDQPAQPPSGHLEVFGEAVDGDDVVARGQCGVTIAGFIAEAQIDFVDDAHPAARAHHIGDAAQLLWRDGGAGGVGGRGQQHPGGLRRPRGLDFAGGELKALRGGGGQHARPGSCSGHEVLVARIARVGHEHFIARIEQQQAGQGEGSRGACGDEHARRVERHAVHLGVVLRDAFA